MEGSKMGFIVGISYLPGMNIVVALAQIEKKEKPAVEFSSTGKYWLRDHF